MKIARAFLEFKDEG